MKPIRINLPIRRGFSFYPFIIIPKRVVGTTNEIPYVAHETTHWDRQGLTVLFWLFRYLTSTKFQMQEETIAFANEIRAYSKTDIDLNALITTKANSMSHQYNGMCTFDEALTALRQELGQ